MKKVQTSQAKAETDIVDLTESDQRKQCGLPEKQGMYDPQFERDACGMGFVVDVQGRPSHDIIQQALTILCRLTHRGAKGAEATTGDGAGIMLQLPHQFFQQQTEQLGFTLPSRANTASVCSSCRMMLPSDSSAKKRWRALSPKRGSSC